MLGSLLAFGTLNAFAGGYYGMAGAEDVRAIHRGDGRGYSGWRRESSRAKIAGSEEDLMDAHTSGGHATGAPAVTVSARTRHATWLAALFVIAFLTPYVLADTLEIQRDVYYALYGGIAITFAWAWGRATEQSWGQMIARRWRLTLLLAALGGAVLIPAAIADTVAPPVDM
jgi:drug/metabolite transporter superfamily protein YnfA